MNKTIGERLRAVVATVLAGVIALSSAPSGGTAMAEGTWSGTWSGSSPLVTGVQLFDLEKQSQQAAGSTATAEVTLVSDVKAQDGSTIPAGTVYQAGDVLPALLSAADKYTLAPVITDASTGIGKSGDVRVLYSFAIPDGYNVDSTTTYQFTLPKELALQSDADMPLYAAGISGPVATVNIPANPTGSSTGTITFTTASNGKNGRQGAFYVDSQFTNLGDENTTPVTIPFAVQGKTDPFTVDVYFTQPAPGLDKTGTFDSSKSQINWTVTVNANKTTINNGYITDLVPAGLTYVPGSFTVKDETTGSQVYKDPSASGTTGDIQNGSFTYTQSAKTLRYDLPTPTSDTYTITYASDVPDTQYGKAQKNVVNLYYNGNSTPITKDDTVTPSPDYIQKSGVPQVVDGKQQIVWTIPFNNDGGTLHDVVITDPYISGGAAAPTGTTIVAGSVKVYDTDAGAASATGITEGGTTQPYYTDDGSTLTTHLGDVDGKKTLTFTVQFPDGYLQQNQGASFTNQATLTASDNLYLQGGVPASNGSGVGVGNYMLTKDGVPDYTSGQIGWTLKINTSRRTMSKAQLKDIIGDHHAYVPGTFTVTDDTAGGMQVYKDPTPFGTTGDIADGGFIYTASGKTLTYAFPANTSDAYTVTYATKLDADQNAIYAGQTTAYYGNQATLTTDTDLNTGVSTQTPSVPYTANLLRKDGDGFDYSTHDLTWKITVNAAQYPLTNVVVTDALTDDTMKWQNPQSGDPAYAFDFDAGQPVQLYIGGSTVPVTLTADTTGAPGVREYYYNAASRTLTFNLGALNDTTPADRTQVISFKMKLVQPVDSYFKLNSAPAIKNTASVTSDENGSPTTAEGSQTINNTVIGKSAVYTANKNYIDWNVQIDQNSVNLGSPVKLSDALQAGLLLDTSSVHLYPQTQDAATGSLTPSGSRNADGSLQNASTPISLSDAQVAYDVDTNQFSFTLPASLGNVDAPYLLTFRTYIDRAVISNGTVVNNTVTLDSTTAGSQDSGQASATYKQNVGGYATGFTGQVTLKKTDAATGAALTGGAEFGLYDQYGNHLRDVTTGTDGTAVLPYLVFGVPYRLTETGAPTGYLNDHTGDYWFQFVDDGGGNGHVQQVTSAADSTPIGGPGASGASPTLAFADHIKTAAIQLTKLGDSSLPLDGAVFTLSGTPANNEPFTDRDVTSVGGTVRFDDVPYGSYTIQEKTAPAGYAKIGVISVTLDGTTAGSGVYDLGPKTDAPIGNLTVTKTDADSGAALQGAVFGLFAGYPADTSQTPAYTAAATGTDGRAVFTDLPAGTYTLHESTAPAGYAPGGDQRVVISSTDASARVLTTATVEDTKQTGTVQFTKQDVQGAPLAGAQFGVYYDQDGKNAVTIGGTALVSSVSGADGIVTFTDFPYYSASYPDGFWVREIQEPKNHDPAAPFQVKADAGGFQINSGAGFVTQTKVTDAVTTGTIQFYKTDGRNKLKNAQFTLYDKDGSKVSATGLTNPAVSDDNGLVQFTNVPYSDDPYTVTEDSSPDAAHYATAPSFTVTLNDSTGGTGKTVTHADVVDTPLGSITVQKQDAGTGDFLAGATFAVKSGYDGNTYTDYTTNADGSVTFSNLPLDPDPGHPTDFTVVEKTKPANYEWGTIGTVSLYNSGSPDNQRDSLLIPFPDNRKLASVTIHKQDADGAPLAGAEFTLFDSATDKTVSANGKTFIGLTGQDGTLTFTGVPYGDYYLKETGVPADYTGDTTAKIPVVLSDTGEKTEENPSGTIVNGGTAEAPTHALDAGTVTNTLMTGTVTLTKTDGTGAALAGAAFTLSGKSTAGKEISLTAQSGADGRVTFADVPYGSYTVKETGVPDNYDGFANAIPVELHESNPNLKDGALDLGKVRNDIKTGTVRFIKQNEFFDPLPGAQFTLSNGSGWSATAVSGTDGTVTFVNVPYGALTLTETQAPAGYYAMAPISIDLTVGNAALQNGVLDLGSYVNIPGTGVLDEFTMRQRAQRMAEEREAAARAKNPKTGFGSSAWPAGAAFALFAALGAIPLAAGRRRKHKR